MESDAASEGTAAKANRGIPTYDISYQDLQRHFDEPLADVARKFNVCTTFFKKVCRHYGISRWPFRKLKSLEKRINDLESKPWHAESQSKDVLLTLHKKVEQIRSNAGADPEHGEHDHSKMVKGVAAPRSPDSASRLAWQEAVVTRFLSSILRRNLFSVPLSDSSLDASRLDSIRGACVFSFEARPCGASVITYMSRGCYDLYGLAPHEAMAPDGVAKIVGAILPEDAHAYAESVAQSRASQTEWTWRGRVRTQSDGDWNHTKWIRGRSMPCLLPNGVCRWEGFLFEDGITSTTRTTPDLTFGMNIYNDILYGSPDHTSTEITEMDE